MRRADGDERAVGLRPRQETREIVEVLRMLAHLLAGEDRALVEMYLEHGNSLRQIGRLMRLARQNVGRRIRRIIRRLTDDTYEICLGNREDFNGRELAMIKDYFVCGHSMSFISRNHGVTVYLVKSTIRKAQGCARSAKAGQSRGVSPRTDPWGDVQ